MPWLNLAAQSCKDQTLKRRLGYMHPSHHWIKGKSSHGRAQHLECTNLPITGPCVLLHKRCVGGFHMSLIFLLIVAGIVAGILGVRWLEWGPC